MFADLHVHPHYFKYWDIRWLPTKDAFFDQMLPNDDLSAIKAILNNTALNESVRERFKHHRIGGKQAVVQKDDLKSAERASMGGDYSQSNPIEMRKAKTRLAVVSLTPVERGWFIGAKNGSLPHEVNWFRKHLMHYTTSWEKRYAEKILSVQYDYFHEMLREYFFYQIEMDYPAHPNTGTLPMDLEIDRAVELMEKSSELSKALIDNGRPVCVFSLESLYIFSQKSVTSYKGVELETVPIRQVLQRINLLKDPELFKYPFLYLTYSHHFSSGYAGHARSLPTIAGSTPGNQAELLFQGLLPNLCENAAILAKLLCIKELSALPFSDADQSKIYNLLYQNEVKPGERRILIDVKHLPPQGRKEFYDWFIRPFFHKPEKERIPVLASHVGYANKNSLNELIQNSDSENNNSINYRIIPGMNPSLINLNQDNPFKDTVPFLTWGINLSDEDIAVIIKSRGLIGICFDQRILGCAFSPVKAIVGDKGILSSTGTKEIAFGYIWSSILAMAWRGFEMCTNNQYDLGDGDISYIWKMFTLGTDFDGMIDPPFEFSTVGRAYPEFSTQLYRELNYLQQEYNSIYKIAEDQANLPGFGPVTGPDSILERICWLNLYEFIERQWKYTSGNY